MNWRLINTWLQVAVAANMVTSVVNAVVTKGGSHPPPPGFAIFGSLVGGAMEVLFVLWCVGAYTVLRAAGHSDRVATDWTAICWYVTLALGSGVALFVVAGGHAHDHTARITNYTLKVIGLTGLILLLLGVRRLRAVVGERVANPVARTAPAKPAAPGKPAIPADEFW